MPRAPFHKLATIAGLVFIADFASKRWALAHLADADATASAGVHLALINNTRLAWGLESGGFELEVTALATVALALLAARIHRQLLDVDASAHWMLGLLLGAGAANLADALIPPHGVVDFIGINATNGVTTTFNVADVAAAAGLALCTRTVWRIAQTIRGRREASPQTLLHSFSGIARMRDRLLVSGGYALLAMCSFVWLYSMAIAWTPNAGSTAPSALLLGVGVFAATFVASQARQWAAKRRFIDAPVRALHPAERVVLDGSLAAGFGDASDVAGTSRERPSRREMPLPYAPRPASDLRDGDRA